MVKRHSEVFLIFSVGASREPAIVQHKDDLCSSSNSLRSLSDYLCAVQWQALFRPGKRRALWLPSRVSHFPDAYAGHYIRPDDA